MFDIQENAANDGFDEKVESNGALFAYKRRGWLETCRDAPLLADIDEAVDSGHPCVLVEGRDSRALAALLDAPQAAWPLWFVKLPQPLWPYIQELATRFPFAMNRKSDDLLHNHTYYLCLAEAPERREEQMRSGFYESELGVGFVFFSGFVKRSIVAACELGGINILLRAGPTAILSSFTLNEYEIFDLQGAGGSSGPNWRPHRVYSEEELAAVESRGAGGDNYVLGTLPMGQYSCAVTRFEREEP